MKICRARSETRARGGIHTNASGSAFNDFFPVFRGAVRAPFSENPFAYRLHGWFSSENRITRVVDTLTVFRFGDGSADGVRKDVGFNHFIPGRKGRDGRFHRNTVSPLFTPAVRCARVIHEICDSNTIALRSSVAEQSTGCTEKAYLTFDDARTRSSTVGHVT
jgi:hypothetical protein